MKIPDSQTDHDSLVRFGTEAVTLLCARDFRATAARFGYMRAFDRDPAEALESDLAFSIAGIPGATRVVGAARAPVTVKYFQPNDTGLFALLECRLGTDSNSNVLVELVVIGASQERHLRVEDISAEG